jgi:hypothetical protein
MVLVGSKQYKMGRMVMSHMASDNLPELFAMAKKIGVDGRHFQDKPNRPHFDICQAKKKLAIQYGARMVHDSEIITMMRNTFKTRQI